MSLTVFYWGWGVLNIYKLWLQVVWLSCCVINGNYRVRTGPGKPGKSWNFIMAFSRTGKSWKKATGPGKLWKFVKLS